MDRRWGAPDIGRQLYSPVPEDELYRRIAEGNVFSSMLRASRARLSLAGAQDKLPIRLEGEEVLFPENGSPSTHIMKFPSRDYRDLPANEVFTTSLARLMGLRVVDAWIFRVKDIETCVVSSMTDTAMWKPRQASAPGGYVPGSGISPFQEVRIRGGPSFKDCLELVDNVCTEPIVEREQLLRWLIFNLLTGNSDAHAKNLSLLFHSDGKIELAPFYDLLCTVSYANIDRQMAMSIGAVWDPDG